MGTWNRKLFNNDTACDVRDTYIEFLKNQYTDEEAYQKTYKEYEELIGSDEEPLFWYAIAATQWQVGRLMPFVKEQAILWIDRKGGVDLWQGSISKKWEQTLEELGENLSLPMMPKKSFKKPIEFISNPWSVGDVYAYKFHSDISKKTGVFGKYLLFHKIGDCEYYKGKNYSIVKIYNRIFDNLPDLNEINNCSVLPLIFPKGINGTIGNLDDYVPSFQWYLQAVMLYEKKSCYPKNYFIFIGNKKSVPIDLEGNQLTDFYLEKDKMESWLIEYYSSWNNSNY